MATCKLCGQPALSLSSSETGNTHQLCLVCELRCRTTVRMKQEPKGFVVYHTTDDVCVPSPRGFRPKRHYIMYEMYTHKQSPAVWASRWAQPQWRIYRDGMIWASSVYFGLSHDTYKLE